VPKKVYISGPMTGKRANNVPAFTEAAAALRAQGYDVISPAELDCIEPVEPFSWEAALKRDLKHVVDADVVATLEGWRASRGARLEVYVAQELGIPVLRYPSMRRVAL
jgi:hypothetical protein